MSITLQQLVNRRSDTAPVQTMMERANDFASPLEAQLTGIAMDTAARGRLDLALSETWEPQPESFTITGRPIYDEVIIGSGFHAAVYAAARVLSGFNRPLVLERSDRVGGVFAAPNGPAFYLNSRNRPGGLGLAGDQGVNLNYLPGAPIQTANLSNGEYQTNDDMAFIIRLTLAMYADVMSGFDVESIDSGFDGGESSTLRARDGRSALSRRRIIDARGLGGSRQDAATKVDGVRVVPFDAFMRRMADAWPLRGVRRAAVIGDGDAARCALESLLGVGPQSPMTAPAMDQVERVDAYGVTLQTDCTDWKSRERGRYAKLAPALRPDRFGVRRLNVVNERATAVWAPTTPLVNGRAYDLVVLATGNTVAGIDGMPSPFDSRDFTIGNELVVAKQFFDRPVFQVGPKADLPFSDAEFNRGVSEIENNRVAMFRLASKTAALAAALPR